MSICLFHDILATIKSSECLALSHYQRKCFFKIIRSSNFKPECQGRYVCWYHGTFGHRTESNRLFFNCQRAITGTKCIGDTVRFSIKFARYPVVIFRIILLESFPDIVNVRITINVCFFQISPLCGCCRSINIKYRCAEHCFIHSGTNLTP